MSERDIQRVQVLTEVAGVGRSVACTERTAGLAASEALPQLWRGAIARHARGDYDNNADALGRLSCPLKSIAPPQLLGYF